MTGQLQTRLGGLTATRVLPDGASAAVDLSNVIPFARARRAGAEPYAPAVTINPAERPAPLVPRTGSWLRALLLLISLIAHSGLFYLFWQEPQPLPGIGIEAMTVDLVIGDNRPAGAAKTPGLLEVQDGIQQEKPDVEEFENQVAAETREVKPEEARRDVAVEQPVEQPKEEAPETRQVVAMAETPQAEMPTVLPRETPPDMQAVITVTQQEPKELKPIDQRQAVLPYGADAARGRGKNGMSADAIYLGHVSAHLQRHKQYPASADRNRITGRGKVTFAIDSSGQVTSASVTVGTGVAVLDQELTAMVRRASPFPPPPDGEPRKFNVPVSFEPPK